MKADIEILVMQLHSTQMSMQASMAQAEIVLKQLQGVLAGMEAAEAAPSPSSTSAAPSPASGCAHPEGSRDLSVRVMGHPRRFRCRECHTVVDPDEKSPE